MLSQSKLKRLLDYCPNTGVFTWRIKAASHVPAGSTAGTINSHGYRHIKINDKKYYAHRLAWLYQFGEFPASSIDHINGIPDDNRIENLRLARSQLEQVQNRKLDARNKSGFPGVHVHKETGKWRAQIRSNGKQHHLGLFDDIEEAAEAYREAKKRLHKFCPKVRGFSYEAAKKEVA